MQKQEGFRKFCSQEAIISVSLKKASSLEKVIPIYATIKEGTISLNPCFRGNYKKSEMKSEPRGSQP